MPGLSVALGRMLTADPLIAMAGACVLQGWEALNLHSWKAYDKGQDIHLQGVPSQVR